MLEVVNCRVGFSGPGPRQTKGFILEVSAEHLLRAGEKPGSHPFLQDEAPSHRFQSRGTECAVTPARPHDFCSPPRATLAAGMFPTHVGVFLPRGLVLRIPSWLPSSRGICQLCVTPQLGLP